MSVALAAAVGSASPARAALSGDGWTEQALQANYSIGDGEPLDPVSCVRGTEFCAVIADDSAVLVNGFYIGQAALVTNNAGQTWVGYATLPSKFQVTALSRVSATTCYLAGNDWTAGLQSPAAALTTDGGGTWSRSTDPTLSHVQQMFSVSCLPAAHGKTTCLAATVGLADTTDKGKTWSTVTSDTTNEDGSVSCLSVSVCVATTDSGLWVTSDDGGLSG